MIPGAEQSQAGKTVSVIAKHFDSCISEALSRIRQASGIVSTLLVQDSTSVEGPSLERIASSSSRWCLVMVILVRVCEAGLL